MSELVGHLVDKEPFADAVVAGDTPEWVTNYWRTFRAGLTEG